MANETSALGPALQVEGVLLYIGNGASPEVFTFVANATDMKEPTINETVDVTNFGDAFRRRIATLSDMGKIGFKIFWIPTEPTHMNAITGAIKGIRYLLVQKLAVNWKFVYPDGLDSTDEFPAYVTSFNVTGKVGGVFEAEIELSNSGPPTLV